MPKEMLLGTPKSYTSLNLSPGNSRLVLRTGGIHHKPAHQNTECLLQRNSQRVHCRGHWETPQQKGTLELEFDEGTDV